MNDKTVSTTTRAGWTLATFALAAAVLAGSNAAHALPPGSVYGGLQAASISSDGDAEINDIKLGVLLSRVGIVVNDMLRLEGRFGVGVDDDTQVLIEDGVPIQLTTSIQSIFGAYALFTLPIDPVMLYAVAGYTTAQVEVTLETARPFPPFRLRERARENYSTFGVGIDYAFADRVSIGVEYLRYSSDIDAISLGFTVGF